MTKNSFNMFGRLPIYPRSKESAISIGAPVLVESTNERLSGRPRDPSFSTTTHPVFDIKTKRLDVSLPQITLGAPFMDSNAFAADSAQMSPLHNFRITRKPAPARAPSPKRNPVEVDSGIWDGSRNSPLPVTGVTVTNVTCPARAPPAPSHSHKPSFGFNSFMKGRRKHSISSSSMLSISPPASDNETTQNFPPRVSSRDPARMQPRTDTARLHLRQSTFQPLHPPRDMIALEAPPPLPKMPSMPALRTSSINEAALVDLPLPSPPKTPDSDNTPEGRVRWLEYEKELLERKRMELRRDIWKVEQKWEGAGVDERKALTKEKERHEDDVRDVDKQLHDLGMKLHRAYRKLDERDGRDGTSLLWVSRTTRGE